MSWYLLAWLLSFVKCSTTSWSLAEATSKKYRTPWVSSRSNGWNVPCPIVGDDQGGFVHSIKRDGGPPNMEFWDLATSAIDNWKLLSHNLGTGFKMWLEKKTNVQTRVPWHLQAVSVDEWSSNPAHSCPMHAFNTFKTAKSSKRKALPCSCMCGLRYIQFVSTFRLRQASLVMCHRTLFLSM